MSTLQQSPQLLSKDAQSNPLRTGVWIGLASIVTMFTAFTSAAVVREGAANDWEHIALPGIIYLNTAVLLVSSVALELVRRKVQTQKSVLSSTTSFRGVAITLAAGCLFLLGQIVVWKQLHARGFYLSTGPSDAFFYVLTVAHALHVLGGLGGLTRVMLAIKQGSLRESTLDAVAYYWHFMGALWVYLLFLLWLRF